MDPRSVVSDGLRNNATYFSCTVRCTCYLPHQEDIDVTVRIRVSHTKMIDHNKILQRKRTNIRRIQIKI